MQLMPSTAKWCALMLNTEYEENRLTEPAYNIRLGVYYLSYLLKLFNEKNAVAAYNAGQGNVAKWISEGVEAYPFKETRDYVERVFTAKKIYGLLNR